MSSDVRLEAMTQLALEMVRVVEKADVEHPQERALAPGYRERIAEILKRGSERGS